MKQKIFLDCGYYVGSTLERYIAAGIVDPTWTIYAFEPNAALDLEDTVRQCPLAIHLIKKAVWIKDGTVPFWLSRRSDASHIEGTTRNVEEQQIEVETLDFSQFVSELPEAYIICSMDIEGAEYQVLAKMLEEKTLDKIDVLDIEFHDRFMVSTYIADSRQLIDNLITRTAVRLKVSLS